MKSHVGLNLLVMPLDVCQWCLHFFVASIVLFAISNTHFHSWDNYSGVKLFFGLLILTAKMVRSGYSRSQSSMSSFTKNCSEANVCCCLLLPYRSHSSSPVISTGAYVSNSSSVGLLSCMNAVGPKCSSPSSWSPVMIENVVWLVWSRCGGTLFMIIPFSLAWFGHNRAFFISLMYIELLNQRRIVCIESGSPYA